MIPLCDSGASPEVNSSKPVIFNASAESGNQSTMLSVARPQTSEQDLCHKSTESRTARVSLRDMVSFTSSMYRLSAESSSGFKQNMSYPIQLMKFKDFLFDSGEEYSNIQDIKPELTSSGSISEPNSLPKDCSSSEHKVIVENIQQIESRRISALQHCLSDFLTPEKSWTDEPEIDKGSRNMPRSTPRRKKLISEATKTRESDYEEWFTPRKMLKDLEASKTSEILDSEDGFTPSNYPRKRIRRSHTLKFHIRPGRGMKIQDIDYVVSGLSKVSPNVSQLIHYILFGTYGNIRSEAALELTKENILHFSGFAFDKSSEEFKKKYNSLMRLPYGLLFEMYNVLIQQASVERPVMVQQLLQFCLKPARTTPASFLGSSESYDGEVEKMKTLVLSGPSPVVLVERLSDSFVNKVMEKPCVTTSKVDHAGYFKYRKPCFIEDGPGDKLKFFPNVASGVLKARRRVINVLHTFLFGRPGSDNYNRLNILEFNGFIQHNKSFFERKMANLNRTRKDDLRQIYDIFSLGPLCGSKILKKKLLFFLQAPSLVLNCRRRAKELQLPDARQTTQKLRMPEKKLVVQSESPIARLRDFETVCLNIECAPPSDLTELNDLLFLKPCDVSEIHDKILNFTPFSFDENSSEYYSRKTLLHYMTFEVVRKIARILDIPYWKRYLCQEELATTTLKFLMEMHQTAIVHKKQKHSQRKVTKKGIKRSSDEAFRPHILMVQRDQENEKEPSSSDMDNSVDTTGYSSEPKDVKDVKIVIQRISGSSYSWIDSENNDPITISRHNSDESLSLNEFVRHPTENQLELTIKEVICSNSWSITTGDLLHKVLQQYPEYNLTYRSEFIKAKALEILQEMQECLVDPTLDIT